MLEISLEYWNKLAAQTLTISSLLGGFSIAVIANLIVSDFKSKWSNKIMIASILAACFFLITVFAMTSIFLKTTEGYPVELIDDNFTSDRIIGMTSFMLGIVSLIAIIMFSGWTKSRRLGIFTTAAGILTLILILIIM